MDSLYPIVAAAISSGASIIVVMLRGRKPKRPSELVRIEVRALDELCREAGDVVRIKQSLNRERLAERDFSLALDGLVSGRARLKNLVHDRPVLRPFIPQVLELDRCLKVVGADPVPAKGRLDLAIAARLEMLGLGS